MPRIGESFVDLAPVKGASSLLSWFGGKRTLAPVIVKELGPHSSYWEPFVGSFSVVLSKPVSRQEVVNDLHGGVVNLARVLASSDAPLLHERLVSTLYCETLHKESLRALDAGGLSPLDWAYHLFVASWMGRSGETGKVKGGERAFSKRYSGTGGKSGTRFRNAVDLIPAWHERLRNVEIWAMDAFSMIPKIEDGNGVVVYCDPPYLVKSGKYVYDFTESDHARLADQLQRFGKTRVVVSYYDHPSLAILYPSPRWRKVECVAVKSLANSAKGSDTRGRVAAQEVLLVNDGSD